MAAPKRYSAEGCVATCLRKVNLHTYEARLKWTQPITKRVAPVALALVGATIAVRDRVDQPMMWCAASVGGACRTIAAAGRCLEDGIGLLCLHIPCARLVMLCCLSAAAMRSRKGLLQVEVTVTVHLPMGVQMPSGVQMVQMAKWILRHMPETIAEAVHQAIPQLAPPKQKSIEQAMEEIIHMQWVCMRYLTAIAMLSVAAVRSLRRREESMTSGARVQIISDDEQEESKKKEESLATLPFRSAIFQRNLAAFNAAMEPRRSRLQEMRKKINASRAT